MAYVELEEEGSVPEEIVELRKCVKCGHDECPSCDGWCDRVLPDDDSHTLCCDEHCQYEQPERRRFRIVPEAEYVEVENLRKLAEALRRLAEK